MATATGAVLLLVGIGGVVAATAWRKQERARRIPPDLLVGLGIAAAAGVVFIAVGTR
jgi:hypothetical protein